MDLIKEVKVNVFRKKKKKIQNLEVNENLELIK